MLYLDEMQKGNPTETGLGRVHFRCVTCDQKTDNLPKPWSQIALAQQKGSKVHLSTGVHAGVAIKPPQDKQATMVVEKGAELDLYGADGGVYRGRGNTTTMFAPGQKQGMFTVTYRDKLPGNQFSQLSLLQTSCHDK